MPKRKNKIVTDYIYHVYNRGVAKLPIFIRDEEYQRAIRLINYYRFATVPSRYSIYLELPLIEQQTIFNNLRKKNDCLVEIITFTLMPNHFHFTLKQIKDDGIARFMSIFENSYTKYINIKNDRVGPLFQGRFKTVLVKTEEQLWHLSRYHHLNPYTAGLVKTFDELLTYRHSSLVDYLGEKTHKFVSTDIIYEHFKTPNKYKKFVLAQLDYQRKISKIRKLLLE